VPDKVSILRTTKKKRTADRNIGWGGGKQKKRKGEEGDTARGSGFSRKEGAKNKYNCYRRKGGDKGGVAIRLK